MAKHGIKANRRKEAPRDTIRATPTVYETTKPAGSAERFLDDAAREALASAAVAAMPAPNLGRFVPGAVRDAAIRYPDPLLADAARLPEKALAESAARAEAYRRAMEVQKEAVHVASTALSPVGNMVANQAGAAAHDALTRQDTMGGDSDEAPLRLSFDPGTIVDYRSMRESSDDPEVKGLYHSSSVNLPHPIDVDPALRGRFERDALDSLESQVKATALVSALPAGGGASILGNAAIGGATGALASRGNTTGELARDVAIGAGTGAVATAAVPLVNKAVGRYMSWTDAGVTKAKEDFLREFVKAWAKKHNVPEEYAGAMARRARRPRPAMRLNTGASTQAMPDEARPSVQPSSPAEQPSVPPKSPVEQPPVPPEAMGPDLPELTDADLQTMAALDKDEVRRVANAFLAQQDAEAKARWTADLVSRYGEERAALMESVMDNPLFNRYFYGNNKVKTLAQIQRFQDMRKMVNAITEPNEIVVGGSAGISTEGTIFRDTAAPHDLDFSGYIGGASRRTDKTEQAVAEMMEALSDRSKIESSPVVQKLRQLYPELRDAKFRYADHDWQWGQGAQYEPGVLTVPLTKPTATGDGYVNRLVTTKINGENVDLMLSDGALGVSSTNPRFGNAETANAWKRYYGTQRRSGLRSKDKPDLEYYKPFSEDNRVIDLSSGRTQFSPDAFDAPLVNDDGLPTVFDVETYPGSGETVPVFMNTRGDMLIADDSMGLYAYDPTHPQNIAQYANIQANEYNKPLVAIRGANPSIRADPRVSGEIAPSIGIYPANNLEALVDDIIKGGRWSSTHGSSTHASTPKDILIYPRSAVDPKSDVRNLLWDSDAFTEYVRDVLGPTGMEQLKQAVDDPKALDALARIYGEKARKPATYYREIGNAYRNKIYENNPTGRFNYTPEQGDFYHGYGEAKPSRYVPDYIRISNEEISKDPAAARAKILEALKKTRFAVPLAAGAGLSAEAAQQDAKGGDTRSDAEGGDAGSETAVSETPVSETPQNPGGPRIVINPQVFDDKRDALCVAFNEAFRVWMEANGFEPQSEPTDAQRKFFSDTAYADDEVQLRRTILARIATFDTSVKDPTDDQLSETASFLGAVLESGWCRNEWERDSVSRLMNAVQSAVGAEPVEPRQEPLEAKDVEPLQRHAAMGGGETEDEKEKFAMQNSGQSDQVDQAEEQNLAEREAQQPEAQQPEAQQPEAQQPEGEHRGFVADAQEAELDARAEEHVAAAERTIESLDQHIKSADALGKIVDNWNKTTDQILAQGEGLLSNVGKSGQGDEPSRQKPVSNGGAPAENRREDPVHSAGSEDRNDGRLRAGIDRSQFGKDGRIGIGARIVDPETGKSRSSLSMNGPAIKPARAIGDLGSRNLTDTKSMNGPAIRPARAIGDMGSMELADPASMNGPAIEPARAIGDMGSRSLTDTRSMNGPALKPRRRIGDMGGRTLVDNRKRT